MTPKPAPEALTSELAGAERIAVLAVGSELHGDDAAGLLVGHLLEQTPAAGLRVFLGSTAPENCTGPMRQYRPSHLVIVDAADIGALPGTIELLDPSRLGGIPFTTHSLPLTVVLSYLGQSIPGCRAVVVGIQPESLEFGAEPTVRVAEAARQVAAAIRAAALGA